MLARVLPHDSSFRRLPWLAASVLILASGCGSETAEPTAPALEPTSATATATALTFSGVSAGAIHSCALTTTSRIYCWGWNVFGQVGDGKTAFAHPTPSLVVGDLRFLRVSAGEYRSCGITLDYLAYCWGISYLTGTGSPTPVAVPGGHLFRQVSVGVEHTCAVTTDDRAYCWGLNNLGQFGTGVHDPSDNFHPVPEAVAGGHRFRQVSAGGYHTCGVTTDNRAYCWGGSGSGQIGDSVKGGETCTKTSGGFPVLCRRSPALVAGGHPFRQLEAGGGPGQADPGHTCAVTTDDRAFCWGVNAHGQIGNGNLTNAYWPKRVAGGLRFRNVTAGVYDSCGATTDDHAYCWGGNLFGEIGDGTTMQRLTPVPVAGGLLFNQISAGEAHSCARTPAGLGYCWGQNGTGQLGDGTTITRLKPRAILGG
jgi:alpha-tubulin suppressor-like RCC1 family protein